MSWEHKALWSKAKLYFERAFSESKDDPLFGLWASLALELLGRAAIASVSPTLLAEPDENHRYLLHALGKGSGSSPKRSIRTAVVLKLCESLFPTYSKGHQKTCSAMMNVRNEELHTGAAAFDSYPSTLWLAAFYEVCEVLAKVQGETLETLFGSEEASIATKILDDRKREVRGKVESEIAAFRKVFEAKPELERNKAAAAAEASAKKLSFQGHHKVAVSDEDGEVVVRRAVSPRSFSCEACGLNFHGYAELEVANLAGRYTRTTRYSPEEYYGLIDPDAYEPEGPEYDNE
jgi:hypothetical protein